MKKAVAFLLVFLIFVTPITTLVKADVVIGDNDETIINENATILGRKLALMESFSDLALSGVTEFTISNSNDVDSYLEYLWEEIDDSIESLSDGTGFTEISNNLKSKYFTNLVQYKDYINNRGIYLAQLLPSGSPTTTHLSTFFANNIYGKQYTQHYDLALDMFKSLSALTGNSLNPNPDVDYSFVNRMNNFASNGYDLFTYDQNTYYTQGGSNFVGCNWEFNKYEVSYYSDDGDFNNHNGVSGLYGKIFPLTGILNINIDTSNAQVTYTGATFRDYVINIPDFIGTNNYRPHYSGFGRFGTRYMDNSHYPVVWTNDELINPVTTFRTDFSDSGFDTCINYIFNHFCNVNLFVDGVCWAANVNSNATTSPTLDIDGFLKIFGNDNPTQYEIQPQTKIDYDQLYQVIYNAIRDNLPISQGDINYYDSHDTIYSPTIINNYGEEEGYESDLIDTILDYAVIPKFDTAIAQPMRQALTNGVVIMNNSITNVIPNEILLILGACFFLLLFAVVINRMIK